MSAPIRAQDEFVGVSLRLNVRASVYAPRTESAQVFAGEPIELTVTVINNTKRSVTMGNAGRHWSEELSVLVQPEGRVVVIPVGATKAAPQGTCGGPLSVGSLSITARRKWPGRHRAVSRNGGNQPVYSQPARTSADW